MNKPTSNEVNHNIMSFDLKQKSIWKSEENDKYKTVFSGF